MTMKQLGIRKPRAARPGTTAYLYIAGFGSIESLISDPELLAVVDDQHASGGLLFVLKDHSSVVHPGARFD
jgi:hypothetical protein